MLFRSAVVMVVQQSEAASHRDVKNTEQNGHQAPLFHGGTLSMLDAKVKCAV